MASILFLGRHHMLTKFQHDYLKTLINKGIKGKKIDKIIFGITSADHANTRRNPLPLYLRVLAIEKFSKDLGCDIRVYPIPDVKQTDKFAKFILEEIEHQSGEKLNPKNTILASSTPNIISMFKKLGFENMSVELIDEKEKYSTLRPFEVVNLLVKSGKKWKNDAEWKKYASVATQEIYLTYNSGSLIIELFNDSVISEDANLTETRDYNSYARGMDQNIIFKFNEIKPFIVQGKIVDAGCGTGALIWHLSNTFEESDIIGIEATRKFYEYCKLQDYPNPFVFFYRKNILDQNFKNGTINSFIYSSVLHEIYSYIGKDALLKVLKGTYNQLATKGRLIIRDVVGPENKYKKVLMELNTTDGKNKGDVKVLSTHAKFYVFVKDFIPRKIKYKEVKIGEKEFIELTLQDAYEFISKMNYTDNWKSEVHEEFGFWSINDWKTELEKIGFSIVAGSHTFKSEYIIEKMYKGKVKLFSKKGKTLIEEVYPATNLILAAEK